MPPPLRTIAANYHFHAYDYPASAAWQLSAAQPARQGWQFYSMQADLAGLVAWGAGRGVPNLVLTNWGTVPGAASADGVARDITGISFGGPAVPVATTPEVVITGGIHAREWIAPEMTYLLAEYLIRNYQAAGGNRKQRNLRNLVNSRRIHIIPLLNPNGNHHSVFGVDPAADPRMWRKNRRVMPATAGNWLAALTNVNGTNLPFRNAAINIAGNCEYEVPRYDPANGVPPGAAVYNPYSMVGAEIGVDLNRNLGTPAWGYNCGLNYLNATADQQAYFGPARQSEPETGFIDVFLAARNNVRTSIDYHSYSKFILYPSEAVYEGRVNASYTRLGQLMQQLIAIQVGPPPQGAGPEYRLGTPLNLLGYEATGTVVDREALAYRSRAFVIELDPDPTSVFAFRLPENLIITVFEKNIRGALGLIASAGERRVSFCCFGCTISGGERNYLSWNVFGRGNQLPV